jgi:23S rRNA (pseudouridine1915-N3)-methyltransferase
MRIKVCWVGKTQNAPIKSLCSEYLGRLNHLVALETVEIPDLSRRRGLRGAALLAAEHEACLRLIGPECRKVVLDERGRQFTSPEFARWLESEQLQGTREIAFVLGGPEGMDRAFVEGADLRVSLGKMTWTHEMARVLLLEQIYRALSILRNIPYHK